ncbi:protein IQ-DOMAIN 14-like [Ananas comosus]|uniref:Protein IQ-DOMAIN 14-like n=1 Tax=Ananas comosus TaxID=4615 RepID=A0A6P5EZ62_ANACO|nr:protein IQ-DOMAIN 14-like [Ananas comosus]
MGKKGSWFAALKRALAPSSKDKPTNVLEKRSIKEKKKWGFGKSKHGDVNSFIPLYREPSSIEKILGDAEMEQQQQRTTHQLAPEKIEIDKKDNIQYVSPKKIETQKEQHHREHQVPPKKVDSGRERQYRERQNRVLHQVSSEKVQMYKPRPRITPTHAHISATKIQAAYRGYLARRNYRALKGLIRLQGVMRGVSVKRQTMNTMRYMQALVRIQSQIHARRLQMMEIRSHKQQHMSQSKGERETESTFGKWNSIAYQLEAEGHNGWDDSILTKEEVEARTRRKVEAVTKRERGIAYAYSHQPPQSSIPAQAATATLLHSGHHPWRWAHLDRHLPTPDPHPSRATPNPNPNPKPNSATPRPASVASTVTTARMWPHPPSRRTTAAAAAAAVRDDDSLTSCPPFGVPNYMAPTASAMARVRAHHADHHQLRRREEKRRRPFSFARWIGGAKEAAAPPSSSSTSAIAAAAAAAAAEGRRGKHRSTLSISGFSVDSTVSLPAGVGRRPFK